LLHATVLQRLAPDIQRLTHTQSGSIHPGTSGLVLNP